MKIERKNIYRYLKRFFTKNEIKGNTLAIAYSGGIDSSVLLDLMIRFKKKLDFDLVLVHVNYNLRGEDSIKDRLFSENSAIRYNIPIYIKNIDSKSFEGKNVQIKARKDRYDFFDELYKEGKYDFLLLAHHKDDLIETIVYRMIKGAGSDIAVCMKNRVGYILRPLMSVYRKDIEYYASEKRVEYREDITNKTNKYARNKIRNSIIPILESINCRAKDNIVTFCNTVYRETKPLRKKTSSVYSNIITNESSIFVDKLKEYASVIQDKVIVMFLAENKIEITRKRVSECKKIMYSNKPNIKTYFGSYCIVKSYNTLYILKNAATIKSNDIKTVFVDKDGEYNFYNINFEIKTIENRDISFKDNNIYLNIEYPFLLRNRKDGDIIYAYPKGDKKYLRRLFIDLKIPVDIRDKIPVIEKDGKIVSVACGFLGYGFNKVTLSFAITEEKKIIVIKKL